MEIKGQLSGVGLLLPLCGFDESNSDPWNWRQAPLLTEPSRSFLALQITFVWKHFFKVMIKDHHMIAKIYTIYTHCCKSVP